jgi:RNA polymerase sigma-70 factor (ECF subfamily)
VNSERGAEVRVQELFETGAASWPRIGIERAAFERHLRTFSDDRPPQLAYAGDLYLACGCALGLDDALSAFESSFVSPLAGAVARIDAAPAFVADTVQSLRIKLFVRDPPKIATYGGRAKLSTWLTTFAVREALDQRTSRQTHPESESLLDRLEADVNASPELDYLRDRYKDEIEAGVKTALERLVPRDRTLLRLHLGERMGIDRLAVVYGVGRSTAARWLATARETLLALTEQEVRARLGVTRSELRELGQALRSQLDVSLVRLLASVSA